MTIKNIYLKALNLQIADKVKLITREDDDRKLIFEVNDEDKINNVVIQTKKGRTLISCDCHNCTMFCNEPTQCANKIASQQYYFSKILKLK
jgi:hypothetical protein